MTAPIAILAVLYAGGYLGQFIGNYALWKQGGGYPGDGTSPLPASPGLSACLRAAVHPPYGIYGLFICIGLLAVLLLFIMRIRYSDTGEYDEDRNFTYSAKGTYDTSGWMSQKERKQKSEIAINKRFRIFIIIKVVMPLSSHKPKPLFHFFHRNIKSICNILYGISFFVQFLSCPNFCFLRCFLFSAFHISL